MSVMHTDSSLEEYTKLIKYMKFNGLDEFNGFNITMTYEEFLSLDRVLMSYNSAMKSLDDHKLDQGGQQTRVGIIHVFKGMTEEQYKKAYNERLEQI